MLSWAGRCALERRVVKIWKLQEGHELSHCG
jgi:hypothetical protein